MRPATTERADGGNAPGAPARDSSHDGVIPVAVDDDATDDSADVPRFERVRPSPTSWAVNRRATSAHGIRSRMDVAPIAAKAVSAVCSDAAGRAAGGSARCWFAGVAPVCTHSAAGSMATRAAR